MRARRKAVCNSRLSITASSTLVRSLLVIRVVETISTEPVRFISHRVFICPVSRFKTASKVAGKGVMNVAERFIRRPVVAILMMLGILLLGVTGYLFLPAVKPRNLDSPTILVSANLPGASAAIMESSVATPLERQFVTLTGLEAMTSVNDAGFTDIALEFNPNRNIDTAAQDVQEAITRTLPQIPLACPILRRVRN